MKINIRELSDVETELSFTQDDAWVLASVEAVDEKVEEPKRPSHAAPGTAAKEIRPIKVDFSLRMVDEVIILNGHITTYLKFLCSRCGDAFHFHAKPSFSALFCKDPVMAGVGHLENEKPAGQNQGHARHAHDESHDTSGSQDLDITYLSDDFIELGDVLTEQLQLQVPFQPLCKESCKGICTQCGTDLNLGRCACAKIAKSAAFSVLQNLKL